MVSKAREGKFEEGTWGLEFGKAFVGVTQHIVSHTSEIYIYLPQHSWASTTPHTLAYTLSLLMNTCKY